MGVVDEDGIVLSRRGDDLYPALDALRGPQSVGDGGQRDLQRERRADDAEGVINAEDAGDTERDRLRLPFVFRVKLHAVRQQLQVLCAKACRLLRRMRQAAAGGLRQDAASVGIVHIDDAGPAAGKEHGLGVAVGVHGLVEVEVVLGEVREHADAEGDLVRAVQDQRVGRDLHDDVRAARGLHLGEQLLQLEGFGRRALGMQDLVSDHVLDGADEADLRAEGLFEHVLEQIRARGLAVRAGDADHAHAV